MRFNSSGELYRYSLSHLRDIIKNDKYIKEWNAISKAKVKLEKDPSIRELISHPNYHIPPHRVLEEQVVNSAVSIETTRSIIYLIDILTSGVSKGIEIEHLKIDDLSDTDFHSLLDEVKRTTEEKSTKEGEQFNKDVDYWAFCSEIINLQPTALDNDFKLFMLKQSINSHRNTTKKIQALTSELSEKDKTLEDIQTAIVIQVAKRWIADNIPSKTKFLRWLGIYNYIRDK